jgi:hypothetical protein
METFLAVLGLIGTFYFGVRSMFQSSDFEMIQRSLRAYNQALFNNLWRMGENAERALKANDLAEAQQLSRGIADMSQTARNMLVSFSKEHTRFVPFYEPAWEPRPLEAAPERPWWRVFFRL